MLTMITEDIPRFWQAFDQANGAPHAEQVRLFEQAYFKPGSPGLQAFLTNIESAEALVDTIERHPQFYRSIRSSTLRVSDFQPVIQDACAALTRLYPAATVPPLYCVIGRMTSGGTTAAQGVVIGTEMHSRTAQMPLEELSPWHRQVLKPIEQVPFIVVHELIHIQQQYGPYQTLLEWSIMEGAADFLGQLAVGSHINPHIHEYGNVHERELWHEFRLVMQGGERRAWLYNGEQATDRPADLGYFVGYKICEAYYTKAAEKSQAIHDILHIQDFAQFLQASGYAEQF